MTRWICGSLLLLVLASTSLAEDEASFRGLDVSEWVARLSSPDDQVRGAATDSLSRGGADAVPVLLAILRGEDARLRALSTGLFGEAVTSDKRVAPALRAALTDPMPLVGFSAGCVLISRGLSTEAAVLVVAGFLSERLPSFRLMAVEALGLAGRDAAPAADALFRAMGDADATIGRKAAYALGTCGGVGAHLKELMARVDGKYAEKRLRAVIALRHGGAAGAPAVPALLRLSVMDEGTAGNLASLAILEIGPAAAPYLVDCLRDEDRRLRSAAADRLLSHARKLGDDLPVAAILAACEVEENDSIRMTLGACLSSSTRKHLPLLTEALASEKTDLRRSALSALGYLGNQATDAVPAVLSLLLNDPESWVRESAAKALVKIGSRDAATLQALEKATTDPDAGVREEARAALAHLAESGPEKIAALVETLSSRDVFVRTRSAKALVAMGGQAVPALVAGLGRPATAEKCAEILGQIGPAAAAAVPALVNALVDWDARFSAGRALEKIHDGVVPALIAALGDSRQKMRDAAVAALCDLELPRAEVIAALQEAVKGDDPVRGAAKKALERLR